MTEMDVYETPSMFLIVGRQRDSSDRWLLQVNRMKPEGPMVVEESEPFTQTEVEARLAAAGEGTPPVKVLRAYVLLGTIRFLEGHYMVFVTGRQCVGILSGHAIYRVEETAMLSLSHSAKGAITNPNETSSDPTESQLPSSLPSPASPSLAHLGSSDRVSEPPSPSINQRLKRSASSQVFSEAGSPSASGVRRMLGEKLGSLFFAAASGLASKLHIDR